MHILFKYVAYVYYLNYNNYSNIYITWICLFVKLRKQIFLHINWQLKSNSAFKFEYNKQLQYSWINKTQFYTIRFFLHRKLKQNRRYTHFSI